MNIEPQTENVTPAASAVGSQDDTFAMFITWTTYGTWLPGDDRGWRNRRGGPQTPQPLLAAWSREQRKGEAILLETCDRETVEHACRKHCQHGGWHLFAVNARTNVHIVVDASASTKTVRNQLKANCTRELRKQARPLDVKRTWTKGGDCELLDTDDDIEAIVFYVNEAQ